MAISKSAKIQAEIEKVTAKIAEQQARLKELEQKKLEAENSEIVEIVRGMSVSLTDLPVLLQAIKTGGALGQNVPKSADKEDSGCAAWRSRPTPGAVRNGTGLILWSRRPWKPLTPARASPRTATL